MSTSKKLLVTLLALAGIAVAAVGASFSSFTASPLRIESQAFANGSLSIGADRTSAIFSISDAVIGSEATGSVTIADTGSIAAHFTMSGSIDATSDSTLAGDLKMTIYQDNDATPAAIVYQGPVSQFSALDLGTFHAKGQTGDKHTYFLHVLLPTTGTDTSDNALQGKRVTSTFSWNATQA